MFKMKGELFCFVRFWWFQHIGKGGKIEACGVSLNAEQSIQAGGVSGVPEREFEAIEDLSGRIGVVSSDQCSTIGDFSRDNSLSELETEIAIFGGSELCAFEFDIFV